jgi:hypothetical protein
MTSTDGWIIFAVSVSAAVAAYLIEQRLSPSSLPAASLPTQVPVQGYNPVTTNSALLSTTLSSQADVDNGAGVQPQTQTEAAYVADPSYGSATDITTGLSSTDSDYAQYDDPNEVLV